MKKKVSEELPRRKKRFRPGVFLLVCFSLAFIGSSTWNLWKLYGNLEQQLNGLNKEKATLTQQQKTLNEEIVRLNTPSYIEQLAREQLGLVKRGEIMIAPKK